MRQIQYKQFVPAVQADCGIFINTIVGSHQSLTSKISKQQQINNSLSIKHNHVPIPQPSCLVSPSTKNDHHSVFLLVLQEWVCTIYPIIVLFSLTLDLFLSWLGFHSPVLMHRLTKFYLSLIDLGRRKNQRNVKLQTKKISSKFKKTKKLSLVIVYDSLL